MRIQMLGMIAVAACVVAVVSLGLGCEQSTAKGESGRELTLLKPANQTITQGDTNKILITVTRTNFEGEVEIDFDDLPDGVSVVNDDSGVARDDNTTTVTLVADADADIVENHLVKITAEGPDGLSVSEFFKLSVKRKS